MFFDDFCPGQHLTVIDADGMPQKSLTASLNADSDVMLAAEHKHAGRGLTGPLVRGCPASQYVGTLLVLIGVTHED